MSSGGLKEYQYTPLNQTRGEQTRLFCLAPGSADKDVFGKLQSFSLDDPDLPPFTALSYTWGSSSKDAVINIESKDLPITSNLQAALKHLRQEHEQRWVWVDAICINQADDAEKSSQVPSMHHFYRTATSCLAWLGSPIEDSELGMRNIRDIDDFLSQFEQLNKAMLSTPGWKAILSILDRDYFRRIWIVQELSWAKDVYFTCGGIELHLEQFQKAKEHIVRHRTGVHRGDGPLMLELITTLKPRLPSTTPATDHLQNSLLYVLTFKGGMMATDPRDYVYATLNLIPLLEWPSQPDYLKDTMQVFTEAAVHVMRTTQSLEFLRLCEAGREGVILPKHLDKCIPKYLKKEVAEQCYAILPSWVPNWSNIAMRPSQLRMEVQHGAGSTIYACDAGFSPQVELRPSSGVPNILTMHIIFCDAIQTCRPIQIGEMYDGNARDQLRQLTIHAFGSNDPSSVYHRGQCSSLAEAFWRTLMLDCNESSDGSRATTANVSDFTDRVINRFQLVERELLALRERLFVVTRTGMFGIAPKASETGDCIAMIPGCSVPMVIRPLPGSRLFHIIGESYVHGIMDGEIKGAFDRGNAKLVETYFC